MKRCPKCYRTYADDTLTFCLNDGALLSASYDPQAATLIMSVPQSINQSSTKAFHSSKKTRIVIVLLSGFLIAGAILTVILYYRSALNRSLENTSNDNVNTVAESRLLVEVEAVSESVFIEARIDNGMAIRMILESGEPKYFACESNLRLKYGSDKNGAFKMSINGHPAIVPSYNGSNMAEILITKKNYKQFLE